MTRAALLSILALSVSACAEAPQDIEATPVSPVIYRGLSCAEINNEAIRVNNQLADLTGKQTKAAGNDAAMTAVSLILFWPAAFFIGSAGDHGADIARLRGELQALSDTSKAKGCSA